MIAAAAAGLGWLAGASPERGVRGPSRGQAARRMAPLRIDAQTLWEKQIAGVRRVPGARAETAWIKWCFAIPDADVPAAIAKLNPCSDFHALRCLYARWARLDPDAAWASFRQSSIPHSVHHFHYDESQTFSFLRNAAVNASPRSLIASRMLASMESSDPAAAKAFAARLLVSGSDEARGVPMSGLLADEVNRLVGNPAASDDPGTSPAQSAAAAAARPDGPARSEALELAAQRWLQQDPSAACAWLQQLPPRDRKSLGSGNVEQMLSQVSPADRTRTLQAFHDGREDGAVAATVDGKVDLHNILRGEPGLVAAASRAAVDWTRENPGAAMEWLATLRDGSLKASLTGAVAGAVARTDVNTAIGLLNDTGGDQSLAVGAFMRSWLESDARAALEWAESIDDASLRDIARSTAGVQLADADPVLALEIARTVTDSEQRQCIVRSAQFSLVWNPAALRDLKQRFPGYPWLAMPPWVDASVPRDGGR